MLQSDLELLPVAEVKAEGNLVFGFERPNVVDIAQEPGVKHGQQCISKRRAFDALDVPARPRFEWNGLNRYHAKQLQQAQNVRVSV